VRVRGTGIGIDIGACECDANDQHQHQYIVLTTHGTSLTFKGLFKGRGYAAVRDEGGISVFGVIQSCYCRHLGDPIALKLKELKLCQVCEVFRCLSCERIVTKAQIGEVSKCTNL